VKLDSEELWKCFLQPRTYFFT